MSTASVEYECPLPEQDEASPHVATIGELARSIARDPQCNEKWLRQLYTEFVRRRTVLQPGDIYSQELPLLVEKRGEQEITFDQQLFTGVTPDGIFVQLLADNSGFHKLVRQAGQSSYQEPPITGGGNSDEVITARFLETRYLLTGLDITADGDTVRCVAIMSDGSRVPVYPIEDVLEAIEMQKVVLFPSERTSSGDRRRDRPNGRSASRVGATAIRSLQIVKA